MTWKYEQKIVYIKSLFYLWQWEVLGERPKLQLLWRGPSFVAKILGPVLYEHLLLINHINF